MKAPLLRLFAVLAIGAVGLFAIFAWLTGMTTVGQFTAFPRAFSSQEWKSAKFRPMEDGDTSRCLMAFDLRWRVGLTGRSRTDILALLGPDDRGGLYPGYYILCPSPADYHYLELEWHDGKVVSSRIAQS